MKTFKIFSTAALAFMMAACSSDDMALNNSPAQQEGRKVQFTATIAAPNSGAGTRTEYTEVTSGDAAGTINVAWKANDEIALIHNGKKDVVKVETVNEDGSATITGDITVGTDGEKVEVCYPAALWDAEASGAIRNATFVANTTKQDGTLKYIQDNLDVRMGEGTLKLSGDKATLGANVTLDSQIAIWKLTLQDDATPTPAALKASQVTVKVDGTTPVAIASTTTLGTATSTIYLGLDKFANEKVIIEATVGSDTYKYEKEGVSLALGKYYQSTVKMTKTVDLSTITEDYTAKDGTVLTGTLGSNVKISIAAPVAPATTTTVTLKDVTIIGTNDSSYGWAGITCAGSATIILEGTNTVKGFYNEYPGISVPSGGTLTIQGTGSLTASSNGYGAGIGGVYNVDCGDITISGGTITATGGDQSAGIGGGRNAKCGDITISGGNITATGGAQAPGIGGGWFGNCGNITITSGVTKVTATKGEEAPNSIGAGKDGTCGTVTIDPSANVTATGHALSASVVGEIVGSDGKAYAFADKDILPSGTTAEAYIAYKSATAGESRAIALTNDVAFGTSWDAFNSNPGWNSTPNRTSIDNCTWQWPTKADFQNMLAHLGTLSTDNGVLEDGSVYLSSTTYEGGSQQFWNLVFNPSNSDIRLGYNYKNGANSNRTVRAVLAF